MSSNQFIDDNTTSHQQSWNEKELMLPDYLMEEVPSSSAIRTNDEEHGINIESTTTAACTSAQRSEQSFSFGTRAEYSVSEARANYSEKNCVKSEGFPVLKKEECSDDRQEMMFQELANFKLQHGHLKVSLHRKEYPRLEIWVQTWRDNYRKIFYKKENGNKEAKLPECHEIKRLKNIGLFDDIEEDEATKKSIQCSWEDMYQQLAQYKQKHGHTRVPRKYKENPKLGTWTSQRRSDYRSFMNSNRKVKVEHKEKIMLLKQLGLFDDIKDGEQKRNYIKWDEMLDQLKDYKEKYGRFKKVPVVCEENPKLGKWVHNTKANYKRFVITNGKEGGDLVQMERLENVGLFLDEDTIESESEQKNWDDMLKQLEDHKEKYGCLKVLHTTKENDAQLEQWVKTCRSAYKKFLNTKGKAGNPVRMRRLQNIGLVDDIRKDDNFFANAEWEVMIKQFLDYKKVRGHTRMPTKDEPQLVKLRNWMHLWRVSYKRFLNSNGKDGNPARMKCLRDIGLCDDVVKDGPQGNNRMSWDIMYDELVAYRKKHGHTRVSYDDDVSPKFVRWVMKWRYCYRLFHRTNGKEGNPKRIALLERVGIMDKKIKTKKTVDQSLSPDNLFNPPDEQVLPSSPEAVSSSSDDIHKSSNKDTTSSTEKIMDKDKDTSSSGVPSSQSDLDFLGSELRGGFWA